MLCQSLREAIVFVWPLYCALHTPSYRLIFEVIVPAQWHCSQATGLSGRPISDEISPIFYPQDALLIHDFKRNSGSDYSVYKYVEYTLNVVHVNTGLMLGTRLHDVIA